MYVLCSVCSHSVSPTASQSNVFLPLFKTRRKEAKRNAKREKKIHSNYILCPQTFVYFTAYFFVCHFPHKLCKILQCLISLSWCLLCDYFSTIFFFSLSSISSLTFVPYLLSVCVAYDEWRTTHSVCAMRKYMPIIRNARTRSPTVIDP